MERFDVVIVGGGIVGLSTAYQLTMRRPELRVVVLEKESGVGTHQTGHNSGVLHSGIYYKPGSLKARNCRIGKQAMERFCEDHGIDYDICGKVIVAVDEQERAGLHRIFERGQENGVQCEMIDSPRLAELEPHVAGVEAIHVPEAGIVDFRQVCEKLAELIEAHGQQVVKGALVHSVSRAERTSVVESSKGEFEGEWLITCAGLHCDRVTRLTGQDPGMKIVPFRGEFYQLKPEAEYLCNNLIYPVPNPSFPFLGVHFTRMIQGGIECGPNAVLAFAREGYRRRDVNIGDLCESLMYRGFRKLARKYWRIGLGEYHRSFSKGAFAKALRHLMPEIRPHHLTPCRSGVRAQAISSNGEMVDDYAIQQTDGIINVCNAPSPAATSALNIGQAIADRLQGEDVTV